MLKSINQDQESAVLPDQPGSGIRCAVISNRI